MPGTGCPPNWSGATSGTGWPRLEWRDVRDRVAPAGTGVPGTGACRPAGDPSVYLVVATALATPGVLGTADRRGALPVSHRALSMRVLSCQSSQITPRARSQPNLRLNWTRSPTWQCAGLADWSNNIGGLLAFLRLIDGRMSRKWTAILEKSPPCRRAIKPPAQEYARIPVLVLARMRARPTPPGAEPGVAAASDAPSGPSPPSSPG